MFTTAGIVFALAIPAVADVSDAKPSYSRHVQPFFKRYCLECHNKAEPEGGLILESYKTLMAGGDHGPAVVAGKPEMGGLVRMIEGKVKPVMPPRKSKQPTPAEIARVRAWVIEGAKDDSSSTAVRLPGVKPRKRFATPILAVASSPDGKTLAVSGRGEVALVDAASGESIARLPAGGDRVSAITFDAGAKLLAAAAGGAGVAQEVRLWRAGENAKWQGTGVVTLAHDDVIQGLAFSGDGKWLASASYDRTVKIWDIAGGKIKHTLKDHSDSVYGISFSPDGKLLASGGADRAVKVWDVATGNRLYTLGESTDWVYAVAWSPTGKQLAAAGADRSIRVWDVDAQGGKVVRSAFAHEKAVTRLLYTADGKSLFTLGEDHVAKIWDAELLTENRIIERQVETPLSLAFRPVANELLVGRFDGVLTAYSTVTGKGRVVLPLPVRAPVLEKLSQEVVVRGKTTELTLSGRGLDDSEVVSSLPGLIAVRKGDRVTLTVPATAAPGRYTLQLKNSGGLSATQSFLVDRFETVAEVEPNDSPKSGQPIPVARTVAGTIARPGDVDWYRLEVKTGDEIGVAVVATDVDSKLKPVLTLVDSDGNTLAKSTTRHLGHRCVRDGMIALGIRDRDYNGGKAMAYRLSVGPIAVVTSHFPLGARQGTTVDVQLDGVHLGKDRTIRVRVPITAVVGSRVNILPTTADGPLGAPSLVVGEFTEVLDSAKERSLTVPATANGRLTTAGAEQIWKFSAKKGQHFVLEVHADRIGSPLDSTIEILDATGRPLPRAVLRSHARTYIAFRDHDSRSPGIRLETWSDLAVNDYLLVGSEILRIRALPRNPDDDCQFFSEQGQRLGYLGTTAVHRSQGLPMYKVSIHPPGTTFPANGLPLVTVFYRNDDGGPGLGKDSRLVLDPPSDATYQVRVRDSRGEGSPAHGYRLTIRPLRPDFTVRAAVASAVSRGGAVPVRIDLTRLDDFAEKVDLSFAGLPVGFHAPTSNIFGNDNDTVVALSADTRAATTDKPGIFRLVARARVNGKEIIRETTVAVPRVIEPGDIGTTTTEKEVTIRPGGEARLTVTVERRNGFTGRIPVEVQGLPHGVRVLDVGLNGILITPTETRRTIVLQCDPWVEPIAHAITVLARQEKKGSEHAAPSVLLRVGK